jgi:hypothetical protein
MSAEALLSYGMKRIATVKIQDDRFIIDLTSPSVADIEKCIYAFVIGDEILRIGSSKGKLKTRLRAWQNDVSNALSNKSFRTPASEALIWKSSFEKHGLGQIFARAGTVVATPVGELNLYMLEESALIGRHEPRCCNDVARHRRQ